MLNRSNTPNMDFNNIDIPLIERVFPFHLDNFVWKFSNNLFHPFTLAILSSTGRPRWVKWTLSSWNLTTSSMQQPQETGTPKPYGLRFKRFIFNPEGKYLLKDTYQFFNITFWPLTQKTKNHLHNNWEIYKSWARNLNPNKNIL